jgi:hypothetical protein
MGKVMAPVMGNTKFPSEAKVLGARTSLCVGGRRPQEGLRRRFSKNREGQRVLIHI